MIKQKDRLEALHKFKADQVKILIATDVAARGLDIPLVQLVINHTIPNVPKEYVHRVGRTARAGRDGMAISLVTPHDLKLLQAIEETIGTKLTEYEIDGNFFFTQYFFLRILILNFLFSIFYFTHFFPYSFFHLPLTWIFSPLFLKNILFFNYRNCLLFKHFIFQLQIRRS